MEAFQWTWKAGLTALRAEELRRLLQAHNSLSSRTAVDEREADSLGSSPGVLFPSFTALSSLVTSCKLAERESSAHTECARAGDFSDSEQNLLQGRARIGSAPWNHRERLTCCRAPGTNEGPQDSPFRLRTQDPPSVGLSTPMKPINPEEAGSVSLLERGIQALRGQLGGPRTSDSTC
ncbi:unnamed protein product [Rangifer tarandus platyrhynchus]|uniref:Uncharacterized protein n=1 Tax=Rangifer tarandus platyrhynchus TaxID=3082113 RepID=A0ABN8YQV4_RANTA|nr:unnamed protein product [Rangifer tarandus platyrhynchus]